MRRYLIKVGGFTWDSYPNGKNDPNAQQVEFQLITFNPSTPDADQSTCTIMGVAWEQINQQANLVNQPVEIWGGMAPGLPLATHQSQFYGLLVRGVVYKCWGNWVGTEMSLGFSIAVAGQGAGGDGGGGGGGGDGGGGDGGGGDGASSQSAEITSGNMQQVRFNRTGPRSIDRHLLLGRRTGVRTDKVGGIATQQSFGDFGGFGGIISSTFGSASQSIGGQIMSLFGGAGGLDFPLNFVHNLQPNMPLSSAIQETLSKVFPGVPLNIKISPMLKLGYQDAGAYQNFPQYASFIKDLSHSIMGLKNYVGVQMTVNNQGGIDVWDGTQGASTAQVTVFELIGQPTWVNITQVQFTTVMRADIWADTIVFLPKNIPYNISPDSPALKHPPQRTELSFTGAFRVWRVTHNGDFRNPDGVQWSSTYETQYLEGQELAEATQPSTPQDATTIPSDQTPSTPSPPAMGPQRLIRSARRM